MSTTAPPTTQTYYDRFSETYEAERHHGYHRMIDELELQLIRQYGRGRDVFEHGVPAKEIPPCATCHGDHGQGNAGFPRLAGQHADYVVKQLLVFQR